MAIRIDVYDGNIPLLDEIAKTHWGVAKESLSVAGNAMRKAVRAKYVVGGNRGFKYRIVDGKRVLTKGAGNTVMGKRHGKDTKISKPANMQNFVMSILYEKSMKVVVGGMHKKGSSIVRRDGIPTGAKIRHHGVGKRTFAIIQKHDQGGIEMLTSKQANLLRNTMVKMVVNGKYVWAKPFMSKKAITSIKHKKRDFFNKGYMASKPLIVDALTRRYEKIMKRTVANINIKPRKTA